MHSMTGFGRGSSATDDFLATVEVSSVNRKQSEIVFQAPRELAGLEAKVRRHATEATSRGRLQITVRLDRPADSPPPVRIDERLAHAFESAFQQLSATIGRVVAPEASDFLRQPGIISLEESEIDLDAAWRAIEPALVTALEQLRAMRASEGGDLKRDLLARLALLESFSSKIEVGAPARPARYRELLDKRLRDAGLDLQADDERVAKEIALFADRCDISEEITRLGSHLRKFHEYLDGNEPPGRALDFLCQEIHREFNTIGSKSNDAEVAQTVVQAKTELEKIREQVQNIE
jgi:uncharacterized protein (TIGR00255 family)